MNTRSTDGLNILYNFDLEPLTIVCFSHEKVFQTLLGKTMNGKSNINWTESIG